MPKADLKSLEIEAKGKIARAPDLKSLDQAYRSYLGKRGLLTQILRSLGSLPQSEKKTAGKRANDLRDTLEEKFEQKKAELQKREIQEREQRERIDITAPGKKILAGHLHPLTQTKRRSQEIFQSMGFGVAEGPEIESEHYNFDALHIPADHPARDLWDTFWIKPATSRLLLRTHTSPVQIRYMETHEPPLRIIAPGRIFRYEATDANHEINFYQLEGLMVGKNVSAANFKAIIREFYALFFGSAVRIRLRPSYFPFTEPSFEVDMSCLLCQGKGCAGCARSGWLEMMGAGMVHPDVFRAVGYVPNAWQGFAFGMGLDRLAMMKYKINDIRLLYSGDLRFLAQF